MGNNHPHHHNSREGEPSKNETKNETKIETHEKGVSAETLKDQVLLAGQGTSGEDKDKEKQSLIDEKTIKETPPLDGSSDIKQKSIEIEKSKEPKIEESKELKIKESKVVKIEEPEELKIKDEPAQKHKSDVGEDSKDKEKLTEILKENVVQTPMEDALIKTKDVKIVPEVINIESQVKEQVKISEDKNNVETKLVSFEESKDEKALTESKIAETKDLKPEIQTFSIDSDLKIDDLTEKTPLLSQEKTEVEEKTKEIVLGVKKESEKEDNLEDKKAPLEENKEEEKPKNKSSILGALLCCGTPTN